MQTQVVLDETGIHYSRGRHECGSGRMTPELLGIVDLPRRQSLRKYYFLIWGMVSLVLLGLLKHWAVLVVALPLLLFAPAKRLYVKYKMDERFSDEWSGFLDTLYDLFTGTRLWIEMGVTENANTKYHAGAGQSIARNSLYVAYLKRKVENGLGLNITFSVPTLRLDTWSLIILFVPNGVLVQRDNALTVYSYDEFRLEAATTRFIENYPVSPDAEVVDYTWKYINRDGSPDGRFRDNERLPVCINGTFTVRASDWEVTFQTSGKEVAAAIVEALRARNKYIERLVRKV